jgi:8-amino-7-oxononanoate synthase
VDFRQHIQGLLRERERAQLLRFPRTLASSQGPEVVVDGRSVVCLCSNNYLGLASHPSIAAAAARAGSELGFGACASRHITGTMELHTRAESRLARFLGMPSALLFSSGYLANIAALQALAGPDTLVFSDALNHASIIDGCRLSRAEVHVYAHSDVAELEQLLLQHRASRSAALVVTEGLFSMDGDVAPLRELRALCDRFECGLVVDDAHAVGVFGPGGRGLCARDGVVPELLIGTLGKAFGSSGAFLAGDREIVQLVENRGRAYVFSTAPSPTLAAAAIQAIDLVEGADDARSRLLQHAHRLRRELGALGFDVPDGDSPIIPVHVGGPAETMRLSALLLELGVFVHGVRPPTVPPGTSRLRVSPMATHEPAHIDTAVSAFRSLRASADGRR